MTLDTLDAAFVQRWRATVPAPPARHDTPAVAPARPAPAARPEAVTALPARAPTVVPPQPAVVPPAAAEQAHLPTPPAVDRSLVERLLAEAGPQWHAIADRIEAARGRGRRVIAVAGCDRGEGRTTLVAAVADVLRSRGRDVVVVEPGDLPTHAGAAHDKRIVLVDAGIWFPAGPIRRPRLLVVSHGCEAVIVVRRVGRPAAAAIEAALEAIGVEPLGEVVTFVAAAAAAEASA